VSSRQERLTTGGLIGPLFRLAWPIVGIQLLQVAYNLADTLYLGAYDSTAVAAISTGFPIVFLVISVAGGFTTAGSILIAQYSGAEQDRTAGAVAGQTVAFVGAIALVLGAIGFFAASPLVEFLPADAETEAEVLPQMTAYLEIIFLGVPFLFGFYVFSALMRGYGDTRTPLVIMFVSVLVNVVVDPVLIFGLGPVPELGIEGAALATVGSRGLATLAGLYVLFVSSAGPDTERSDLRPDFDIIEEIVRLGIPSAIEQSMSAFAMVSLVGVVLQFGPPVNGAYGVGNRLVSLVFLPAMGLGRATNTMVGQNLGAGRPDRASKAVRLAAGVAAGVMGVVAVLAAVFADPIANLVVSAGDEYATETIALSTDYIRIRSVEFVFIGIMQVILGGFRGAGNTRTAMGLSMVNLWLTRVPIVYGLALVAGFGATGIWIGMSLGHIVGTLVAVPLFVRGTWQEVVIDEDGPDAEADAPPVDEDRPGIDPPEASPALDED
jgi:putative MATE family efflux protein